MMIRDYKHLIGLKNTHTEQMKQVNGTGEMMTVRPFFIENNADFLAL